MKSEKSKIFRKKSSNSRNGAPFKIKVRILISIKALKDLYQFKGLNFESLKSKLSGFYSIRLNKQYRLIFKVTETENEEIIVEVI